MHVADEPKHFELYTSEHLNSITFCLQDHFNEIAIDMLIYRLSERKLSAL